MRRDSALAVRVCTHFRGHNKVIFLITLGIFPGGWLSGIIVIKWRRCIVSNASMCVRGEGAVSRTQKLASTWRREIKIYTKSNRARVDSKPFIVQFVPPRGDPIAGAHR